MSAVDYQLIDEEKQDDSIIKGDFIKIYHQSGDNVNSENSNIKFYSGENRNFIEVRNGYLEFFITIRKADNINFADGDEIRLLNNAFACTIHDAKFSSSSGVEIEQNKFIGPISNIMRLFTQKDGILSTYFDLIDESEVEIDKSSLKQKLINNHSDDNKGSI